MNVERPLKILEVAAEVAPYAKSGGLADVAGSLPYALVRKGHDVRVVMPRYKEIPHSMCYTVDFPVKMVGRKETCIVRSLQADIDEGNKDNRLPFYFIDSYQYFDREGMYCHIDDGERFAFFCKAVLDMLPLIGFKPDIIHCNDWHTGPIPFLLKYLYNSNSFYKDIRTVFTIHNLRYQGNYPKELLKVLGISEDYFTPEQLEFYGQFSFIKTGILYADKINAVSNTYAKEIQTPEFGELMEGVVRKRSKDLYGIVNGISNEQFNPETDEMIYKKYSIHNPELKKENKKELQKQSGLPVKEDIPLVGLVHRLVDQKGLDLILEVMDKLLMEKRVQFIMLGLGDPYFEKLFKKLEEKYSDSMVAFFEFNEVLAHRIYAGSDIFLMPSRFEPCGLGQLISLKYGTIPVVRAVGGLADTIRDFNPDTLEGNGFVFEKYSSKEFLNAMERCLSIYTERKDIWKKLVETALAEDFSWDRQADRYIQLFLSAIKKGEKDE